MTASTSASDRKTSSSLLLTKGLRLLRHVSKSGEVGVREIARNLSLSPTVAHRLVTSLYEEGFLERNEESGRYRVGAQAFEVGRAFLRTARIETCAPPIMRRVVAEGAFNAFLGVMRGSNVVYLSAMQDNGPINKLMLPGSEAPLHATAMGKILLSELADEEILQRVYFYQRSKIGADQTIDTTALLQEINLARKSGYSTADDEAFRGVISVGVPVRDFSRKVIASLSLSTQRELMTTSRHRILVETALQCGADISHALGDRDS
ncbi:IclR family transcriptional regulator [Tardiphaga sp. 866_E4_N2_1]|uniref:IclR family transcriptional regulator n=1 Tax=unclassified Tardiphaga TaxID=2631404 RepID=UPI003F22C59B